MMNNVLKAFGTAGARRKNASSKPLSEDLPTAQDSITAKAPNHDHQIDAPT
jgi:hypothetical protein